MKVLSEIVIPKDNADEEVIIRGLYFKDNDQVKESDSIMDIETSKTSIELEASVSGYIKYLVNPGEEAAIGQVVAKIYDVDITEMIKSENVAPNKKKNSKADDGSAKVITKDAQEIIDKHGIDISEIPGNFIKKEDVEALISEESDNENVVSKKISRLKSLEIRALSSVQSSGLVSTIFINVDINESLSDSEKTISYLPLISTQCAKVLKSFPELNSYFLDDKIISYDSINIGLALDIDDGLKVFVLKDANSLNIKEVESLINEGIYKYLRKELKPDELSGSTFTISDLSQYGVERFFPLINKNQAAILGVSSVDLKLNRFNLSLAFDHRVTEGKKASEFLLNLKNNIELELSK